MEELHSPSHAFLVSQQAALLQKFKAVAIAPAAIPPAAIEERENSYDDEFVQQQYRIYDEIQRRVAREQEQQSPVQRNTEESTTSPNEEETTNKTPVASRLDTRMKVKASPATQNKVEQAGNQKKEFHLKKQSSAANTTDFVGVMCPICLVISQVEKTATALDCANCRCVSPLKLDHHRPPVTALSKSLPPRRTTSLDPSTQAAQQPHNQNTITTKASSSGPAGTLRRSSWPLLPVRALKKLSFPFRSGKHEKN